MNTVPVKQRQPPMPAGSKERDERADQEALIDFESEQSFPASDPPSWTLGTNKD